MTSVLDFNLIGLGLRDVFSGMFRERPKLVTLAPERIERIETVATAAVEIADVLSPSQLRAFGDCQVRWFYKSVLGLPETRSSALGLGSAFHAAIATNFREKIASKQDMPAEVVSGMFRAEWAQELESVTLADDEDSEDMENMGAAMVESYMENVAPLIQPAAVELPVSGEIGGVKVRGKIDILTEDGTIIDAKTAGKKPSGIQPDYRFQVATYVQLHPDANGKARVDTITKTKTIQCHSSTVEIGEADTRMVEKMYPLVQEAMRSGLYVPNRGSNLCSRKHCAFWERCQSDYGGVVDEK